MPLDERRRGQVVSTGGIRSKGGVLRSQVSLKLKPRSLVEVNLPKGATDGLAKT